VGQLLILRINASSSAKQIKPYIFSFEPRFSVYRGVYFGSVS